jgi:hypothetical protein
LVLDVPLIGQQHGYDGRLLFQPKSGKMVPHGHMACWYAAAEMVSKYFRPGPRFGLPRVWEPDNGLLVNQFNNLATVEGLRVVQRPSTDLRRESLLSLLKTLGPLWAAGDFGAGGAGHVIVVTGVRGDSILFNDPWEPSKKVQSLPWFTGHLWHYPNALMAKDPARS